MMRVATVLVLLCSLLVGADAPAKTWEKHLAALTDPRPAIHGPAIEALSAVGAPVLGDLATLVTDADWRVRGRVVTVAAAIGSEAAIALVLGGSRDEDARVRELSALALGSFAGSDVAYLRLRDLLGDRRTVVQVAATKGLERLADPRALADLAGAGSSTDPVLGDVRRQALAELAHQPRSVPELVRLIPLANGEALIDLVRASAGVGDPRLSPVLAARIVGPDPRAAQLAAESLAANGDSRALQSLCTAAAASERALAEAAAATLRLLTGFPAAEGSAWTVWWRDHAAEVAEQAARDAFLADLHDPGFAVSSADLGRWTPDQLMPLVDAALGSGAWWWPRRAFAILARDDAARWTQTLATRIASLSDAEDRLALIVLLDQLGDPAALPVFEALAERNRRAAAKRKELKLRERNDPEAVALRVAIDRRCGGK